MRQTLPLVRNSALRKKLISIFEQFLLVLTNFSFWEEDWPLDYNSVKISDLVNIS